MLDNVQVFQGTNTYPQIALISLLQNLGPSLHMAHLALDGRVAADGP
jgi:hypothetical protein